MEIKRTRVMAVETRRRVVVRQPDRAGRVACPRCAEQMLSAETAAGLLNLSRRSVYRLVEQGEAHFDETEAGAVMVCLASLTTLLQAHDEPRLLPPDATS